MNDTSSVAVEHRLTPLLAPRSMAFVGASTRPHSVGNQMVKEAVLCGFEGPIYPVNPKYQAVEGLTCYASLAELPGPVDHIVIAVANPRVEAQLTAAAEIGARAATVFASGYYEGDTDPPLTERIRGIAKDAGLQMCGGNCIGFYNFEAGACASSYSVGGHGEPGHIMLLTHSGTLLWPLVEADHRDRKLRRYFRADAAFATPEIYEFVEAEGYLYAIRIPKNQVLEESIGHLLTRPVGRPPNHVRRYYASFSYRAGSWDKARRVVAKVEWHPGELFPRLGFIVTNLSRSAERVTLFYNQRGKAEQYIKEGKNAIKWTRLSCLKFRNNAARLQLHALAYNLANFMRTLALPKEVEHWSLTTLREKLVKIGAKIVRHGRYVTFQLAEVAVSRELFRKILSLIDDLRRRPMPA